MKEVDKKEIAQYIEKMKSLQLIFGDIGGRMRESLPYLEPFAAELQGLLVNLRDVPIPKDKDCKRATKLFERAINARLKALEIIVKHPSSRVGGGLTAFWVSVERDMLRDSVKTIASVYEKYQISKED